MSFFIEMIGWIGAVVILVAYALLSAGKITARSKSYQWLNILGASAFVVNSGSNGAYPSAVLNVIWVGIGVWALVRYWSSPDASVDSSKNA